MFLYLCFPFFLAFSFLCFLWYVAGDRSSVNVLPNNLLQVGISVFATGGIGGVHRGNGESSALAHMLPIMS